MRSSGSSLIDQIANRVAQRGQRTALAAWPDHVCFVEAKLGFELPPLLRQVYLYIGDGGNGPGYGTLPLAAFAGESLTFLEVYGDWIAGESLGDQWTWDRYLLPLTDWGCGLYECLDSSEADGPVYRFDWTAADDGDETKEHLDPTHESLTAYFESWLQGLPDLD
ncbi:MAG: SMI1/KNR4 family protein [Planctomycetota bacterium]